MLVESFKRVHTVEQEALSHILTQSGTAMMIRICLILTLCSSTLISHGNAFDRPVGDGLHDDTASLQSMINSGVGNLQLSKGRYRITKPLLIDLDKVGPTSIHGSGVATIQMDGPGPAIRLRGTHYKSADPGGFEERVWIQQRMPLIDGLAITATHPEADGIEATGTMQLTITRTHIRGCRHGIHLVENNRNVNIAHCHIYENHGTGIYYDDVNLHQSNISNSHISYCDQGWHCFSSWKRSEPTHHRL